MAQTLSQSDMPPSRSGSARSKSSLGIVQFGFHAKTNFDAAGALLQTRSAKLRIRDNEKDDDIWKRPPPDFRLVMYDPQPPKRNSRDAIQPWRYGTIPGERTAYKREKASLLPVIFRNDKKTEEGMVTRFRIARPFTAKKQFVKDGMYKPGEYEMPLPHDFRQYPAIKSLGLPEFITAWDRDPNNLKFNSERLNTIHGLGLSCTERDLVDAPQMAPAMPGQPRYDPDLILERGSWPTRQAEFTRHRRRNRQAYSAFMERVERELLTQWAREKMEQALREREKKEEIS